jgi:hypothetical protein
MSGTEARATDSGTTDTTETRDDASSAAERLGGPIEAEQSPDTARRAETGDDRQSDTATGEDEQSADTASRAETSDDRKADTAADEDEQSLNTASRAETAADRQSDTGARQSTTLIAPERAESYNSRWNELKGEFVDEPHRAVRGANELVGEVLDELEELFRRQRADLEHGLDSEQTSTEDLRQALGRYRSFFDRLLSF